MSNSNNLILDIAAMNSCFSRININKLLLVYLKKRQNANEVKAEFTLCQLEHRYNV